MTGHPSSLVIDALASGHLDRAEAAALRGHFEACARCRDDLATAEAACATFTREVLPRTIGTLAPRPAWKRWLAPALLVPLAAAAAIALWLGTRPAPPPVLDDDVRVKGSPLSFRVFAQRGQRVLMVEDGTELSPGNAIHFSVVTLVEPEHAYLMIASIDGAGVATVYFPYGGERSERFAGDTHGRSIVLDAALGPERVFALVSRTPLEAAVVKRALERIGAGGATAIRQTRVLDVPAAAQASVVFEKVP